MLPETTYALVLAALLLIAALTTALDSLMAFQKGLLELSGIWRSLASAWAIGMPLTLILSWLLASVCIFDLVARSDFSCWGATVGYLTGSFCAFWGLSVLFLCLSIRARWKATATSSLRRAEEEG